MFPAEFELALWEVATAYPPLQVEIVVYLCVEKEGYGPLHDSKEAVDRRQPPLEYRQELTILMSQVTGWFSHELYIGFHPPGSTLVTHKSSFIVPFSTFGSL
jgi:hypothetical protein